MSNNVTLPPRLSATAARTSRGVIVLIFAAVLVVFATQSLQARTLRILHAFHGPPDGSGPVAAPIRDKQGNLYSTTYAGGIKSWGTVYKIDPKGKETVLHSFVGGSDGVTPTNGLVMDAKGDLYGTTYWGGSQDCFNGNGCGVVYKLSPGKGGWKETIIYAFKGGADGAYPYGALVSDAEGNLYGTTLYGGSQGWPNGNGVVFKLTHTSAGWKEHVLYAFGTNSQTDGATQYGGVILDDAGNLYGTTYYGGSSSCSCGIVFKIDRKGSETVLYNFKGGTADGGGPMVSMVRDQAGTLYGTTAWGGDLNCNCGTVFKIDAHGVESLLHIFVGYPSDGGSPGRLMRDEAGNLYGAADGGNSTDCRDHNQPVGCGVIFELKTDGKETILHNFTSSRDGAGPTEVNIYQGSLYGSASTGGPAGSSGTVFKLTR